MPDPWDSEGDYIGKELLAELPWDERYYTVFYELYGYKRADNDDTNWKERNPDLYIQIEEVVYVEVYSRDMSLLDRLIEFVKQEGYEDFDYLTEYIVCSTHNDCVPSSVEFDDSGGRGIRLCS